MHETPAEVEYRVVYQFEGKRRRTVIFQTRKAATRRQALLASRRPWAAYGLDPDAYACCHGLECGCGGITVREDFEQRRSDLPRLLYARVEVRSVGPWLKTTICPEDHHA